MASIVNIGLTFTLKIILWIPYVNKNGIFLYLEKAIILFEV